MSAGLVMAVDVVRESELRFGGPRTLFALPGSDDFAVWHDRFLIPVPLGDRRNHQLHVVVNWTSELRR